MSRAFGPDGNLPGPAASIFLLDNYRACNLKTEILFWSETIAPVFYCLKLGLLFNLAARSNLFVYK
jgi:hypothetical protein